MRESHTFLMHHPSARQAAARFITSGTFRGAGSGAVLPVTEEHIAQGVAALAGGRVIAVPTDTLYGVACAAWSEEGIRRVYEIKERDASKALAICVGDVSEVPLYGDCSHLPKVTRTAAKNVFLYGDCSVRLW